MPANKKRLLGLDLVGRDLEAVESLLAEETRSEVQLVIDVSRHILDSGGKRFRPMLTLLVGRMLGLRRKKELICYAAGIEFAHTSTLLHDDVIDEGEVRRGKISANRAFGNSPSIIVGDYVLFKGFSLMVRGKNMEVLKIISNVAVQMAEGEAYQLTQKSRIDLGEKEYEKIIRGKTALLIQAACEIPAIAAGATPKQANCAGKFGYLLGLAFQIADDVLDYSATDKGWGKKVGQDFLEGKTTLPLIFTYQAASKNEREELKALYKKPSRTREDFQRVMELIAKYDALNKSKARAMAHVEEGKKQLQVFPDNAARRALSDLADYVVERVI